MNPELSLAEVRKRTAELRPVRRGTSQPPMQVANPIEEARERERRALYPLPETGFLRLPQIIGNRKADPPIPGIIPVSPTTWWEGVKTGRYPKPVKLGPKISAWPVETIRRCIEQQTDSMLTPPVAAIEGKKRKRAARMQPAPAPQRPQRRPSRSGGTRKPRK